MRFFRRGQDAGDTGDFWAWWPSARERIEAAIAGGGFDGKLVEEISRAVRGVHPQMAWELAPGRVAKHALCLSAEGNAEIRQAALRWLESAPTADETWEYHASKQASPALGGLQVGPWQFELAAMRAITSWDASRRRLDVKLWHPQFPEVPNEARVQVAFVFLDNLLGEDEVERWIGSIDVLDSPTGGRTPDELRAEIERHRSDPEGADSWILGELTGQGGRRSIVMANASLKRIDHPFADHHVTIAVVLDGGGLPDDALAAVLNAEEDDLLGRLGDAAVYVGRTTEPGLRTMHFVTQDPDGMRPGIDGWAANLPPRRIKVNFDRDMDWSFKADLGLA